MAQTPAARAAVIISPETRVSFPMSTLLGRPSVAKKEATAFPTVSAISTVMGYSLAIPLIPSVPKSVCAILLIPIPC
jgi:hypothetical protein